MKLLTKDTDYAIKALSFIAKKGGRVVSVNELVCSLNVPGPFIRKILQVLNRRRLLKSYRGKGGGFVLACDARNITLLRLIKIFQGPFRLAEHSFKRRRCPKISGCLLKKRLDDIERYAVSKLQAVNIRTLLNGGG